MNEILRFLMCSYIRNYVCVWERKRVRTKIIIIFLYHREKFASDFSENIRVSELLPLMFIFTEQRGGIPKKNNHACIQNNCPRQKKNWKENNNSKERERDRNGYIIYIIAIALGTLILVAIATMMVSIAEITTLLLMDNSQNHNQSNHDSISKRKSNNIINSNVTVNSQ